MTTRLATRSRNSVWALAVCALALCAGQAAAFAPPVGAARVVTLPAAGSGFDYQLGGTSPVPAGATVVARDSTDAPAEGVYGIHRRPARYTGAGLRSQPCAQPQTLGDHPDRNLVPASNPAHAYAACS